MNTVGDALALDLDQVEVRPSDEYSIAGVYSFGRGFFKRGPLSGAATSYKKLNRLRSSQLVLSRLKAFEGGIAVVPEDLDGWFLSPEFPTFTCNEGELNPRYLSHICQWPEFWSRLAAGSKGIGARRERVGVEELLSIVLGLPSIEEQLEIAANLDSVGRSASSITEQFTGHEAAAMMAMLPSCVDALIGSSSSGSANVGDQVDFVSDTVHPGDDPSPAEEFVGLQHIESHTGRRIGSDPIGSMRGRKFRFRPGDVIYGYLRPYLNKVWVADRHGLCSVDQYVLRPHSGVNSAVLAHTLRGSKVLTSAIDMTHSLQLPRLRSGLLSKLEIPRVPDSDAADLASRLDLMRDRVVAIAKGRQKQSKLANSLVPAALNEAFRTS